jgi:hypothetical protein
MRKLNPKKHRGGRSEDTAIANHHARTGDVVPIEKSLDFTGTGEDGRQPSSRSTPAQTTTIIESNILG